MRTYEETAGRGAVIVNLETFRANLGNRNVI
jgi:hypothetical protein